MTFAARRLWGGGIISDPGDPPPAAGDVVLVDGSYFSEGYGATPALVNFQVRSTGDVLVQANVFSAGGASIQDAYDWLDSGSAADYEIRWTPTGSGTPPDSGDVNVWLSLGTSRSWSVSTTSFTVFQAYQGFVEIRLASTQVVQTSANITMSIQYTEDGFLVP